MKTTIVLFLLCISGVAWSQDTTRLSLIFLGDIMQHDSQIADAYDPDSKKFDYKPCFQLVKPYTESADLAIGNLELTLAGPPHKGYPQFSAPDELLEALKDMGMDVLVTANNHCVDRGKRGLERTIEMLDSFGILHTGTFADEVEQLNLSPLLIEKNGFRLALLNYTYGTNGLPVYKPNIVNIIDTVQIRKDLFRAKELHPDAIIVFTHWGAEYQSLPSAWQKEIARVFFRHGAQLVIGAHPHVIQPMEWNKEENRLIAYSLGNFVSGQRKRYTDGGAMIRIELEKIQSWGAASTRMDSAAYILQWVYRDPEKNYFVMPVPAVEKNRYLLDEAASETFQTFVDDSRSLLQKHNKNISELKRPFLNAPGLDKNASDTLGIRKTIEDRSDIRQLRDSPPDRRGSFNLPIPDNIRVEFTPDSVRIVPQPKKKN
jgi:hypothetical protein